METHVTGRTADRCTWRAQLRLAALSGCLSSADQTHKLPDVIPCLTRVRRCIKERSQTMADQIARQGTPGSASTAGVSGRTRSVRPLGAAVVGGGAFLEACSAGIQGASTSSTSAGSSSSGSSSGKSITIGWIHPLAGSLAGFGYPDNWVTQQAMATSQFENGIKAGGSTYSVTVKSYDTQSSVTRAGTLAKQAIQQDNCDLLFASSTPETVNAVASQAESLGTPLVCSNIPWESWYINLGGNPQKPTLTPKWTVMYFLGAEHLALAFAPMWDKIGAKYGNNPQGRGRVPERRRRQRVPGGVPRRPGAGRVHPGPVDAAPDAAGRTTAAVAHSCNRTPAGAATPIAAATVPRRTSAPVFPGRTGHAVLASRMGVLLPCGRQRCGKPYKVGACRWLGVRPPGSAAAVRSMRSRASGSGAWPVPAATPAAPPTGNMPSPACTSCSCERPTPSCGGAAIPSASRDASEMTSPIRRRTTRCSRSPANWTGSAATAALPPGRISSSSSRCQPSSAAISGATRQRRSAARRGNASLTGSVPTPRSTPSPANWPVRSAGPSPRR